MRLIQRWRAVVTGVSMLLLLASAVPAAASSANISHAYQHSENIANGSLVSLVAGQSDEVELANTDNGSRLLGVAVASKDSLLAVDPSEDQVQVATDGSANVLVSDVNGDIKSGDQVAVSPFNGIGMKAEPGSHVIGLAQTGFSSSTSGAVSEQVTDKRGQSQTITVGYVRVSLAVGTTDTNDSSLNGLQRLALKLTGHRVSLVRIIASMVIAFVALVLLVGLTYASIYGSIISIGRNPLAKSAIYRTLTSVLVLALMTAGVAAILIFFLLR